ncbi:MAG: hypothetical protein QOH41_3911 [Blastocatellia bacterium]|nr:hypothetical protein [Blastocatellia bacterium]
MLEDIMGVYRDSMELVALEFMHARVFDLSPEELGSQFAREDLTRSGVLWALKWASEYCLETSISPAINTRELVGLTFLGSTYEAFVDALKCANWDLIAIHVDEDSRTINCYEGGDASGFDVRIVERARISAPSTPHASLTLDEDQLTSRWTAGDYRRVTHSLAAYAARHENTLLVDPQFLAINGLPEVETPQPTLVWLDRPNVEPDSFVFDDLVLPAIMEPTLKWKLVSLLDTPVVQIGERYCALSSDLKAVAVLDDYMLRLAVRIDEQQYSRASLLREERMIRACAETLERATRPWIVENRVLYSNPTEEADVLARRDADSLVIQLKSTLRPQTPWEVFKRNEDLLTGLRQTRSLLDRRVAQHGFVITDGYRGDYICWKRALDEGVPIATLYDLGIIAKDLTSAVSAVKKRVGIVDGATSPEALADREGDLVGWTLRIIDAEAP